MICVFLAFWNLENNLQVIQGLNLELLANNSRSAYNTNGVAENELDIIKLVKIMIKGSDGILKNQLYAW